MGLLPGALVLRRNGFPHVIRSCACRNNIKVGQSQSRARRESGRHGAVVRLCLYLTPILREFFVCMEGTTDISRGYAEYEESDLPYTSVYPPVYRVEPSKSGKVCDVYGEDRSDPSKAWPHLFSVDNKPTDDRLHILAEAWRGLQARFGDTLFFSEPKRVLSFGYRSDREFLQQSERFGWGVHVYQCAFTCNDMRTQRYAGFVLLRPWHVHEKCARDRGITDLHKDPAPAICEGFLRPPLSVVRSPFFSQCMGFYAAPYDVRPFHSIPFFATGFGADCGHNALAAALIISRSNGIYSPFELAIIEMRHTNAKVQKPDDLPALRATGLQHLARIVTDACVDLRPHLDTFKIDSPGVLISYNQALETPQDLHKIAMRVFAERLGTYIFQGIPILYSVKLSLLYLDLSDAELWILEESYSQLEQKRRIGSEAMEQVQRLLEKPELRKLLLLEGGQESFDLRTLNGVEKALKAVLLADKTIYFHTILIHSVVRGQNSGSVPILVYSDTRDLHTTGNIFQRVSCARLWLSRARLSDSLFKNEAEDASKNQGSWLSRLHRTLVKRVQSDQVTPRNSGATFLVCLPGWFDRPYERISGSFSFPPTDAVDQPKIRLHVTLRDRSQLRGYVREKLFSEFSAERTTSPSLLASMRELRERLRVIDIPPLVWVVERWTQDVHDDKESHYVFFVDPRDKIPERFPFVARLDVSEGKALFIGQGHPENGGETGKLHAFGVSLNPEGTALLLNDIQEDCADIYARMPEVIPPQPYRGGAA